MNINTDGFKHITYEQEDKIGILTLNRPSKFNSLSSDVLKELQKILMQMISYKDFDLRGLIFTGAGEKAFIAGADIEEMSEMNIEQSRDFGALGHKVTLLFEDLHIPVIATVHGYALGGGCEMAMACDFILATEKAVFGQPEVKLGLTPGFGGTQRLARLVGRNRAKEIIYSGRNVFAEEAERIGLVLKIYENKDEMISAAKKMLKVMEANSPVAIAYSKQVMNEGNDLMLFEGLNSELNKFSEIFGTYDMKEGTKAFIEKRKADFSKSRLD